MLFEEGESSFCNKPQETGSKYANAACGPESTTLYQITPTFDMSLFQINTSYCIQNITKVFHKGWIQLF